MNKVTKGILDILWYLVVFFLLQLVFCLVGALVMSFQNGFSVEEIGKCYLEVAKNGKMLAVCTALSGIMTVLLFYRLKWAELGKTYLSTRPWGALLWVMLLAVGTILPAEWIYEQMQIAMPEAYEQMFEGIMKEPWGYLAIGIVAPLAEEIVFRGAILGKLLKLLGRQRRWIAIGISAIIFGLIHGNIAQGVHAFIIGLLLGWMFCRTNSVVPGVVFHWVNNTVAYVMYNIMPQMNDGKLIDLFHGDHKMMIGGIFFSLCIFIPSLFQLTLRLKNNDSNSK